MKPLAGSTNLVSVLSLTSSIAAHLADSAIQERCSNLIQTFRPDDKTTVLISEFLPKGTNWTDAPLEDPSCAYYQVGAVFLADSCRMRLNISTSDTSNVIAEIILPVDWQGKGRRTITLGNGGLGGCLPFQDLAYTSSLGFAAVGTNNGHNGDTGKYFLNNPEVLKDFVYRSIPTGTEILKKAVKHFYNDTQNRSYYMGCSTGGRQGFKAAQDYPEQFDGILAGAPAFDMLSLEASTARMYSLLRRHNTSSFVTSDQWAAVHEIVLKQCDDIDGVLDGIIEDPMKCRPRIEALLCEPGQTWSSNKCLMSAQISAIREAFEPTFGAKGEYLYPRMQPGAEMIFDYFLSFLGPSYLVDWFRYVVYNDTTWDFNRDWSLDAFEDMRNQDAFGISTWKPDLSNLQKKGVKLLTYHGLMDGAISSENSYRYYDHVSRSMGLPSNKLDEFYRFFPISGLGHCGEGDGAWFIGGSAQPSQVLAATGQSYDQEHGVLMDLVRWVENGTAPERVRGRSISANGKQMVRDHCKFPLTNKYLGSGDANLETSWGCA
ncbi:Tannase and feruloyl esterase [Orbilia ellipsospora]|uniref:Carboxylic ester hydrolase n=1 Tax=Orbilia ellipsospora TaxID=2528407 RepID=A0AAV9XQJ6_9PEZI